MVNGGRPRGFTHRLVKEEQILRKVFFFKYYDVLSCQRRANNFVLFYECGELVISKPRNVKMNPANETIQISRQKPISPVFLLRSCGNH
jgi:hypothetical protein